jgi:hypothetical protein
MSEESYRPINSLLVEFARDRVRDWKDEVAREAATHRRFQKQESEEEDEEA